MDSLANLIAYYNETSLSTPVKAALDIIKKATGEVPPDDVPAVPDDILKGFNTARLR